VDRGVLSKSSDGSLDSGAFGVVFLLGSVNKLSHVPVSIAGIELNLWNMSRSFSFSKATNCCTILDTQKLSFPSNKELI
jgi:hypothetical protein